MSARSTQASVTPVLDTSIYASGDCMSDVFTIPAGASGPVCATLQSMVAIDNDSQGLAFDVFIFNVSPTVASAKNAAFSITDAEFASCVGIVSLAGADFATGGGQKIATKANINLGVKCGTSGTLYGVMVSRGAGTYTASGVVLKFVFENEGI